MSNYNSIQPRRPSSSGTQLDVDSIGDTSHLANTKTTFSSDEESLLLHDQHEELQPIEAAPKLLRRLVISMSVVMFLLINLNGTINLAPIQKVMEDIICHNYYPDHALGLPENHDVRCKNTNVQTTLAMVRSWTTFSDLLISLFVQIPYGVIADNYGRRPVLILAFTGGLLSQSLILLIPLMFANIQVLFPDVFNIWGMLFCSLPHLIGGGVHICNAVIYTLLTDVTLPAERSIIFSQITAIVLFTNLFDHPLTALLMKVSPWIPIWIAYGAQVLALATAILVPETIQLRLHADKRRRSVETSTDEDEDDHGDASRRKNDQTLAQQAWTAIKRDVAHVWSFVLGSKDIMLLVFTFALCAGFRSSHVANLLQYITRRFHWEWSTATYVFTICDVTSMTVFIALLPPISRLLTNRFAFEPLKRDLLLVQISIAMLTLGSLISAVASVPWLFIGSLVVSSLGEGYAPLFRAVLNSVVERHTIATLNTVVATANTLVALVSTPAFGWLLSKGMEIGGLWTGLPYFVATLCGIVALLVMLLFRVPTRLPQ